MRIGRAIPGADALLFRHTIPSRLGLIIAVMDSARLKEWSAQLQRNGTFAVRAFITC